MTVTDPPWTSNFATLNAKISFQSCMALEDHGMDSKLKLIPYRGIMGTESLIYLSALVINAQAGA